MNIRVLKQYDKWSFFKRMDMKGDKKGQVISIK